MPQRLPRSFFMRLISGLLLCASFVSAIPHAVRAQTQVDYDYILSDEDLTDYTSLNLDQIQAFLASKASTLTTYVDPITSLRAAQIIYQSAQDFSISPKFLLALMQKEQSLVEDDNPSSYNYDWATGYAVCDSCSTDDPLLQKFKGFYNQVYNAAKRIRTVYLPSLQTNGATSSGFGPGIPKLVDGTTVTPANFATAVAYTYTPHLHGNQLLWEIWNRWFARAYPDGTLLNVEGENEVWLVENGLRRQFANRSVYLSRYEDFDRVLTINRSELLKYPEGRLIQFSNYAFLRTPRGTVYLVVDDQLRGFNSGEALRKVGVNPEEIVDVAQEDLANFAEGEPITQDSLYPLGALLQDKQTGGVYWVQDGLKHPIVSRELMSVNFSGRKPTPKTPEELTAYPTSTPVLFREGELVRAPNQPAVYLISNQKRLPFLSEQAFLELGFDWKNVVVASDAAVNLHELGQAIGATY